MRLLRVSALIAALTVFCVAAAYPPALAPVENCQYFSETKRYVCDEFLEYYNSRGDIEIFGYPLTDASFDVTRGLVVQYFQRSRMEYRRDNPEPYRVQLGLLVDELDYHFPPLAPDQIPPQNGPRHHYFPETQHAVSYDFLAYFREKGGLDVFGYPVSEFMYENGYIVQYFQRARMEWYPDAPSGPLMRLTNMGELYADRIGIPGGYHRFTWAGRGLVSDPELLVTTTVRHISTEQEGFQTVYVYVTDELRNPIPDAAAAMVVRYPAADQVYSFPPTDTDGFTSYSFQLIPSPAGEEVVIDVSATIGSFAASSQTFFQRCR